MTEIRIVADAIEMGGRVVATLVPGLRLSDRRAFCSRRRGRGNHCGPGGPRRAARGAAEGARPMICTSSSLGLQSRIASSVPRFRDGPPILLVIVK